jgi:hypothetical protein
MPDTRPGRVRLWGVELDQRRRVVSHRGRAAALTSREADLLAFLMTNPDRYFTAAELARHAWQTTDRSAEAVRVYVRRLRIKLGPLSLPCTLDSQQWLGYRLTEADGSSLRLDGSLMGGAVSQLRACLSPLSAPVQCRALHASGSVAGLAGLTLASASHVAQTLPGHGPDPLGTMTPLLPGIVYLAAVVAAPLLTLGWIAIYVRQSETAGVLGLAGFVLVVPALLSATTWGGLSAAHLGQMPVGDLLVRRAQDAAPVLLPSLGYLLMGLATLRARVFPHWAGWLLVAGALAVPLGSASEAPVLWVISRLPWALALVWMCVLLLREAWTSARRQERVPGTPENGVVRPGPTTLHARRS